MQMTKPRLLICASGTIDPDRGGSGFKNLMRHKKAWELAGVVSNHARGSIWKKACELGVEDRFIYFPAPWTRLEYQRIAQERRADFVACSGWTKHVKGLNPATTFNPHPAPLPEFGGVGMYGNYVQEAVIAAYRRGTITHTAICMHFVTLAYDDGPVFFRLNIPILPSDTPESLTKRVRALEHQWQPRITNLVVTRKIHWSGVRGDPVIYPPDYNPVMWAT